MVDVASLSAYVPRDARSQPTSMDLVDAAGCVQIEVAGARRSSYECQPSHRNCNDQLRFRRSREMIQSK
jgi:hypothetical protein